MNRTQTVGLLSELAFTKRCIELGLEVLAPIGVERYDLVIVLGGEFQRVQVKTGLYRNGAITFATSSNAEGVGRPRSYDGDADLIGVYAPALDRCYLLPVDGCARRHGRLRVDPPRNGQSGRIRWAWEVELERVVASRTHGGPAPESGVRPPPPTPDAAGGRSAR